MILFAERGVIGSQRPGRFFALLYVFVGMTFHTKTQIDNTLTVLYCNRYSTTITPKSTMSSPIVTKKEGTKMTKQTKTKIVVGSVVKAKMESWRRLQGREEAGG